jgi:hypothetical protein
MTVGNDQLDRIWKQIDSGTPYPGWRAGKQHAFDVLSRATPEASWTRTPPAGAWAQTTAELLTSFL